MIGAELALGLQARGHELTVVTERSGELPESDSYRGIPVWRFPFHASLEARNLADVAALHVRLRSLVQRFRPQLVHLHTLAYPAYYCERALVGLQVPLLVTRHEMLQPMPQAGALAAQVLRRADWVACCSVTVLDDIRGLVPELEPRSSVILNGIGLPERLPTPVPSDPPVLVCLGRLVDQKGFDLAITALARLRDRFPAARLVIAGDGPARDALVAQAQSDGVADAVEFTGWVAPSRVYETIARGTAVLFPSRTGEGLPIVALQAAQMGRPVVAARTGGLPEVVAEGETGLLFDPGDANGLAEATAALLESPDLARRLGEAARSRAIRLFSAEHYLDEYDRLYGRLAATRSAGSSTERS